jgi:hypothetical protein
VVTKIVQFKITDRAYNARIRWHHTPCEIRKKKKKKKKKEEEEEEEVEEEEEEEEEEKKKKRKKICESPSILGFVFASVPSSDFTSV